MGASSDLSRAAAKRLNAFVKRPDLPPFWLALQVLVGAAFVGYIFFSLVASGGSAAPPAASNVLGGSSQPAVSAPAVSSSESPSSTAPTTSATVQVPLLRGGSGAVPEQVVSIARAAAAAWYTGNFTGIPLASGESVPVVTRVWPSPQLGASQVVSSSATSWVLSTKLDPDGAGPAAPTYVPVQVVWQGGSWVYTQNGTANG